MSRTHGMSRTRLHNIWLSMRQRCEKPNCSAYKKYGAKGISVCDEWACFENFRDWASQNGYRDDLTIDRINPQAGYCPQNCRWVSQKIQQNNRTNNVKLTHHGKTLSIYEWASLTGIPATVLYDRNYRGWDIERIFNQPVRKSRKRCAIYKKNGCHFIGGEV